MSEYIVEIDNITKKFGDFIAVDSVSLNVTAGSIYGILGPNGAGKTTLIRMILGIIDPDGGKRYLFGGSTPQSVRPRIGYLPEERGLYPAMKTREVIAFMGALRGLDWAEGRRRAVGFLDELGLAHVIDEKIRKMSKGMAQMIQLVGSIIHAPDLIVLDEPFSGLDPVNQERLEVIVRRECKRGATILFSTHVMAHAQQLCDRLVIIARSQRRFEGTVDEARALLPMHVRYVANRGVDPKKIAAVLPDTAVGDGEIWQFPIAQADIEPMLIRLTNSGVGVSGLSIARSDLHDVFVHIMRKIDAQYSEQTLAKKDEQSRKIAQ